MVNTASTLYEFDPVTGAQESSVGLDMPSGVAFGDIAYNAAGTVLYGIGYPNTNVLYTIDPVTGAVSAPTPLTGAALTDTATQPLGTTSAPSVWNGLSPDNDGNLLLGSDVTNQIYELNPTTGNTTHFASFPAGIVSAGDFLTLPDGDVLAVGISFNSPPPYVSIFYLIDPTSRSLTEIGTGPQTFGAAQSGGTIYLATASGAINAIADSALPRTQGVSALPTRQLTDPGLGFYGATSIQDAGACNVTPDTSYTVAKKASPAGPLKPGQMVTYTITVTNTGRVAYTPSSAAAFDDLSNVTDDATYVPGSATATQGTVTVKGNTVTWLGPLSVAPDAGSTVTVTYRVRVDSDDRGNRSLVNTVRPTAAGGTCSTIQACTTTNSVTVLPAPPATTAPVAAGSSDSGATGPSVNTGGYSLASDVSPLGWAAIAGGIGLAGLACGVLLAGRRRKSL